MRLRDTFELQNAPADVKQSSDVNGIFRPLGLQCESQAVTLTQNHPKNTHQPFADTNLHRLGTNTPFTKCPAISLGETFAATSIRRHDFFALFTIMLYTLIELLNRCEKTRCHPLGSAFLMIDTVPKYLTMNHMDYHQNNSKLALHN